MRKGDQRETRPSGSSPEALARPQNPLAVALVKKRKRKRRKGKMERGEEPSRRGEEGEEEVCCVGREDAVCGTTHRGLSSA